MSEQQALTLPALGDRLKLLPWITWGARHYAELDDVFSAVKDWSVVPFAPIRPKWEATKVAGDTIVVVLEDAPPFVQAMTAEPTVQALETAEMVFTPANLLAFLQALPQIIALIRSLTGLALSDDDIIEARFVG